MSEPSEPLVPNEQQLDVAPAERFGAHGPDNDRRIGQVIDGKYHVLRRLACGGMGSVYEARHAVVGRHVALKFLHEQYAQRSCMVQRFLREAQAAGSIASEHIIGVLDYGTTDGTPYLVMELVRGKDLREILAETPRLAAARAVRIVLDACRGLALAHERGLIHRDLKPANICVTRRSDGREVAKVIDFGVAKLRDGAELSEEGTLIGTLGYMAPEQLTDQKELDARADIYALGVILYQALAGRPPHICNRSELLYRIVSVDPRPLGELCPELEPGLCEVVHKALCRSKERRYASVRELARALEPFGREDASDIHDFASTSPGDHDAGMPSPEHAEQKARDTWRAAGPAHADAWGDSNDDLAFALRPGTTVALPSGNPRAGARLGFGTAETELGSSPSGAPHPSLTPSLSPTWVALAPTQNVKADRQCESVSIAQSTVGAVAEQYCRHPDGLPAPPVPLSPHHLGHHLSQRALLLSVGALALSVVAMTTMFIFVYSHGSGALEAAAKASSRSGRAVAHETRPVPAIEVGGEGVPGSAPLRAAAPLAVTADGDTGESGVTAVVTASAGAEHCERAGQAAAGDVVELAGDGHGVSVQQHALRPNLGFGAHPGARALECE